MAITNSTVAKIFSDLEAYRDFCRFENNGCVFDEKALYNKKDPNWQAYEKWLNYSRAKNRNKMRNQKK